MKKNIIARRYDSSFRKLVFNDCFSFSVQPYPALDYDTDLVVLYKPTMREISAEYNLRATNNCRYRIAVVHEIDNCRILESIYCSIDLIGCSDEIEIETSIIDLFSRIADNAAKISFTELERKFLGCLAFGMSTKEMTSDMKLSDRSLRRIKEKLLKKTGLFSIQQLLIYALLSDQINTRSC